MPLKRILQSIEQDADRRIGEAKKSHAIRMSEIKTAHEKHMGEIEKSAEETLATRKRSLREKAESLGRITANKTLLRKKNEEIDAVYEAVISSLASLPENMLSEFFKACLDLTGEDGGVIRAAPAHAALVKKLAGKSFEIGPEAETSGGFVVSSKRRDWDFTFEFLVSRALRPATEVETARSLFAS